MRHVSEVARDIADERTRLQKVIASRYGKAYVREVQDGLQAGSVDYCDDVMQAHYWAQVQIQLLVDEHYRIINQEK